MLGRLFCCCVEQNNHDHNPAQNPPGTASASNPARNQAALSHEASAHPGEASGNVVTIPAVGRTAPNTMELQIRSRISSSSDGQTPTHDAPASSPQTNHLPPEVQNTEATTSAAAGNEHSVHTGMVPRRAHKPEAEYICPNVPYIPQPENSNSCWHAAFNMIGAYHGRMEHTDYSNTPSLYENGEFKFIPDRKNLLQVVKKENLTPVSGCNDRNREYSALELKTMLEKAGPIAFAWRPEYNPLLRANPMRYHWSVIVDADPETNEIVYHDPAKGRSNHVMSMDEFNRQRVTRHDHTMLQYQAPDEGIAAA
jgi:hypothetical protein